MTRRDPEFKFSPEMREIKVWDLGVRFFHWALVILVITSFVTAKIGGNAITYHSWSGFAILTLLIFRILWGVVGGTQARFTSFIRGPAACIAYLRIMFSRERHVATPGHNALGALSVLAMLAALLFQAVSGLFVNDDIAFEGPLYKWAGKELSDQLMGWHKFNEKIIIALIMLHLASIAFYFFYHKDNLVKPMFTGVKGVTGAVAESKFGNPLLALVLVAACGLGVYFLINAGK